MKAQIVAKLASLEDKSPQHAIVCDVDLVVLRVDDKISVLYGRCLHRGALLSDGRIEGENLICPLHGWDYRYETGISEYNNRERLQRFHSWVEEGAVYVDADEVAAWAKDHPQPFDRNAYQGNYQDPHGTKAEPYNSLIQQLAEGGLEAVGHHGPMKAMGVERGELPRWEDLQFVTAQLARFPLLDEEPVSSEVVIGPSAAKPLRLEIPLFVSDMSFGALSEEAKLSLAQGAERAGTGICSGEGGMLAEEQQACSRYFYELASARFGFSWEQLSRVQAFHFKGGQAAKTGTGGHLPGEKVTERIAEVRGLKPGHAAISPARFPDFDSLNDFRSFADEVRERTGGIPIGFKLSAQHIEDDLDAALGIGVDYVILDGRGGGTGAAPALFRDNISVPTIPAIARARRHLDRRGRSDVTLIATGGLRTPADFVKALALGADAIALANSALQAIGCVAMRACHTNSCPVGIATQKPELRQRLVVEPAAARLARFLDSSVDLMRLMARACGHRSLSGFRSEDLVTFKREMSDLTGVRFAGVGA